MEADSLIKGGPRITAHKMFYPLRRLRHYSTNRMYCVLHLTHTYTRRTESSFMDDGSGSRVTGNGRRAPLVALRRSISRSIDSPRPFHYGDWTNPGQEFQEKGGGEEK